MKPALLVNENVPRSSIHMLRKDGFDVLAIVERSPGLSDESVLALAVSEGRWLVTLDRDYGELLFRRGLPAPAAVFYLRLPRPEAEEVALQLMPLLKQPELWHGAYVVVQREGTRRRPLLHVI